MAEWKKVCRICGEEHDETTIVRHVLGSHPEGQHYLMLVPVFGDVVMLAKKKEGRPVKKPVPVEETEDDGLDDLSLD